MPIGTPVQGGPDASPPAQSACDPEPAVIVRTEDGPKELSFEEETQTLVVNVHGALILLAGKVRKGQKLRLTNRATQGGASVPGGECGPKVRGQNAGRRRISKTLPGFLADLISARRLGCARNIVRHFR